MARVEFDAEVVHAHRSLLQVSDPRYRNQILDRITVGQMTLPGYATMPTRAVGIDLRLWAELSDENRRRFRDRIGAHRHDLLLIGISESPTAPDGIEPDYLVERNGAWILRMPASDPVLNAPAGSLADVLLHLTEEFLILPSTMALLSGPDLRRGPLVSSLSRHCQFAVGARRRRFGMEEPWRDHRPSNRRSVLADRSTIDGPGRLVKWTEFGGRGPLPPRTSDSVRFLLAL